MTKTQVAPVKSIETTIEIIETIEQLDGARVSQLANEMNIAKSTIHDHLTTLKTYDFLVKEDDEYRIGLRFLDHGGRERKKRKLYQIAKPEIKELAMETGEVVNLVVEEHGRGVYLMVEEGPDAVIEGTHIGKRGYMHSTAVGRAILAQLPEERVKEIIAKWGLPQRTENTITSQESLIERLDRVQERGYAIDKQEDTPGLRCVATSITVGEKVLGGISISGPMRRFTDEKIQDELAEKILQSANVIEINVTHA